jgi:hypothetical protein
MAPADDDEIAAGVDFGPHIAAFGRKRRQTRRHIDGGKRLGRRLDVFGSRHRLRGEAIEDFKLHPERAFCRTGDLGFEAAKLGRGETDSAGEGLAVNERGVPRRAHQLVAVLGGHLDEIAEHVVVPDFQRPDLGLVGIARLQGRNHAPRFVAQRPRLVEGFIIMRADKSAVAPQQRQVLAERGGKLGRDCRIGPSQRDSGVRNLGDLRR